MSENLPLFTYRGESFVNLHKTVGVPQSDVFCVTQWKNVYHFFPLFYLKVIVVATITKIVYLFLVFSFRRNFWFSVPQLVFNVCFYVDKVANKAEKGQGQTVVLDLVEYLSQGYRVTTDNFFTVSTRRT